MGIYLLMGGGLAFAQQYGLDARSAIGPFLNNNMPPTATVPAGGWTVVNAFPNLTFQDPTFLTFEPGANRLYVCGREGYIWSFANASNTTSKTLFLDLSANTQGWDDCGLLGIAFHPQYGQAGSPNRGYVYVYYQYQLPGNIQGSANNRPPADTLSYNRLSRFTVPDGSQVADPNSEVVLINLFDRHLWHNGGGMFFGPDGFLYLSNGDEGGASDQYNQAQKINGSLFSGVLRIDVDQDPSKSHPIRRHPQDAVAPPAGWPSSSSAHYYIPNDNPWQDPGGSILEEFWAIGLRSPHRMTYDPPTGQIWLGDVGQDVREEVDLIVKGGNYQWGYWEGTYPGPKPMPSPLIGNDTPPVYDYPHDQGDGCVIGGYVYRGAKFAADLGGKYIFGDNDSGRIWTLVYNGSSAPTVTYLVNMPPGMNYAGGLSSFGRDQNNELYMCAMGPAGQIWRLERTGSANASMPALLSQTGAFANVGALTPAAGLVPYDVNSALWSDGASKRRWIAVPNNANQQINFSPTGEWTFPVGTVLVKHFELGTDDTNPNIRKRLETRLEVLDSNGGVYGVTYKWRADNSDADLLPGSLSEDIPIATGSGTRIQTWYYPSQQDCLTCHTPIANYVLGVKTRQQNGNFTYPSTGRTDNQLRTWNHIGLFNPPLNEASISTYSNLVSVTNASAPLEARVRSYLDANCAQCHRPNGVSAYFDARYDTTLGSQGIVNGALVNTMGIAGAKVVLPGDVSRSMMYQRMNSTGADKMPPLARNLVDAQAVSVLSDWINSLPPTQNLPSPWVDQDIGNVGVAGNASYSTGTFTIQASGDDIWNTADAFHFVFQPMNGDGQIVARVTNVQNTDGWAKAGVMIRETLTANSREVSMFMAASQGASFQRRVSTGGVSTDTTTTGVFAPYWVKLVRSGNTFTGYRSSDGNTWVLVGSDTVAMGSAAYVGLAVTAHNNTVINTSALDNVQLNNQPVITGQPQNQTVSAGGGAAFSVTAAGSPPLSYQWRFNGTNISGATASSYSIGNVQTTNAGNYSVVVSNTVGSVTSSNATLTVTVNQALPPPWSHQDIGNVVLPGNASYGNGTFTIQAAGDDIWNNADAFHYVYQPMNGDGQIVARVVNVQNTDGWAKSGVMMRETLTANSREVSMFMAENQGASFQRRVATGGISTDTTVMNLFPPYWVKLTRTGNTFAGYDSSDGTNWVLVGSDTVAMAGAVYVGLAVTAHNTNAINTSAQDNVVVTSATSLPAVLISPQLLTNGQFTITLTAAPGSRYEIQGSTNFTNWTVLAKLTNNVNGQAQFTEPNLSAQPYRFYRAHLAP
ncbi:MAG: hypothetical protein JWR19_2702 [Pedosphaera sp.]|nr:hypothetical protein [Pedosphaera sp.]